MGLVYLMFLLISLFAELFIISSDLRNTGPLFVRQWSSGNYSQTTGKIIECQIQSQTNLDRTVTYRAVQIKYQFEAGGHEWEAGRFSYFDHHQPAIGHDLTGETVSQYAAGSAVRVYYNPNDPADALLFPGPGGDEIVLYIYKAMGSLYLASVFWVVCWPGFRRAISNPPAGGVKIVRERRLVRVQLPWFNPAVITMGVGIVSLSCFSGFLNGRHASVTVAGAGLILNNAVVIAVFALLKYKIRSGKYNLEIDKDSGSLVLPVRFFHRDRLKINIPEIVDVTTKALVVRTAKGNQYSFVPSLELRHHGSTPIAIVTWSERKRAESFTAWLRSELEIK